MTIEFQKFQGWAENGTLGAEFQGRAIDRDGAEVSRFVLTLIKLVHI